jgi:Predicted nucleotide-binding protein containing TIR-like domain
LELSYFVGRLGRKHVCALKRGDLEIPSDFGGVGYEQFDVTGGWKQALGRELEAAGTRDKRDWQAHYHGCGTRPRAGWHGSFDRSGPGFRRWSPGLQDGVIAIASRS